METGVLEARGVSSSSLFLYTAVCKRSGHLTEQRTSAVFSLAVLTSVRRECHDYKKNIKLILFLIGKMKT